MMRRIGMAIAGGLIAVSTAGTVHADSWTWNGKLRMGGTWLDQTGDESTMPETYNIYDGFMLSSIHVKGRSDPSMNLLLDLTDINRNNRQGYFNFRRVGMLDFRSRYIESRWVFDSLGNVNAGRKNWDNRLSLTPWRFLRFAANYNMQSRDGNRIDLHPGYEGWLGTAYDSKLHRYRFEGQAKAPNGIGGMLAYDGVKQNDALNADRERNGYMLSANFHVPGYKVRTLTHVLQAAIGRSENTESGLGFDMMTFGYTGVWQALQWMRWRYRFYGSQVDDESNDDRTNNFYNDFDGTFSYRFAVLMLGYGWEALDDDYAITNTHKFRGSLSLRDPQNKISGRVTFDGHNRDDVEKTTLLKDSESQRWDVRIDANPFDALAFGVRGSDRQRDYPDIGVKSWGTMGTAYAAWRQATKIDAISTSITNVGVEYTYTDDEYDNLTGTQHVVSNAVTGRLGLTVLSGLDLTGSFTYLELSRDLDLEKSILSFGAAYRFPHGFLADVKYNVYNYDDYLILDRFYTANVVWFNVGYEFSTD